LHAALFLEISGDTIESIIYFEVCDARNSEFFDDVVGLVASRGLDL
jgi:hypothetical protein